jgi:hypothetical protein
MIAYTQHCLPCTHKAELKALKVFAAENKLDLEVRQVTYDRKWQTDAGNLAKHHKVEFPFVHHEGKAVNINDDFSKLLPQSDPALVNEDVSEDDD